MFEDWSRQELLQLGAIIGTVVVGLIGLWLRRGIKSLHVELNGRLTQLLKVSNSAARAEGIVQERADSDARGIAKAIAARETAAEERADIRPERTGELP